MGGVRTGVGGGSRGKLGVQRRTVQVTAVAVPTYRCVEAPSPWGEGKGLCAKGAWDRETISRYLRICRSALITGRKFEKLFTRAGYPIGKEIGVE